MVWFKADDRLPSSRKAAKAGVAAMGLWVLAGCWSAGEELDGFVPSYMVTRLGGAEGEALASSLVSAGFWLEDEHDGEAGYRFHQWAEYQPTRAQLEAKREQARERMNHVRANGPRTSQEVTPTPTRPDPTKEKNTAAKAAEHADDFAAFWQQYPRKVGKAAAEKAYAKARKSASADALAAGLRASVAQWAATRTEPQYVPHATTWLNQGRWEDDTQSTIPLPDQERRPTLAQCSNLERHERHQWEDARNLFHCQGVAA